MLVYVAGVLLSAENRSSLAWPRSIGSFGRSLPASSSADRRQANGCMGKRGPLESSQRASVVVTKGWTAAQLPARQPLTAIGRAAGHTGIAQQQNEE